MASVCRISRAAAWMHAPNRNRPAPAHVDSWPHAWTAPRPRMDVRPKAQPAVSRGRRRAVVMTEHAAFKARRLFLTHPKTPRRSNRCLWQFAAAEWAKYRVRRGKARLCSARLDAGIECASRVDAQPRTQVAPKSASLRGVSRPDISSPSHPTIIVCVPTNSVSKTGCPSSSNISITSWRF